ncbi:MAG: T9SS type A sorting domain-containing protein [Saprospiraceae bacterium]|nr:T9SS type A sorting domain-containing protein [Saprospiraceae bacterium]
MVGRIIILLIIIQAQVVSGQYDYEPVFRNLHGEELKNAVKENYMPQSVLTLTQARDTIYRRVYYYKDSVRCIYTGRAKFLDLNQDPSQYLFDNGGNIDINLEHSYPRSKGADTGNAASDMHALFPSRVDVNSERGSDPYDDIIDSNTIRWYVGVESTSNPDQNRIDVYSEDNNSAFEPRESVKGNVARASFYFYTIYEEQANNADPNYFQSMVETLCEWHNMDPVDSLEWVRNMIIASYQDGKANPFILDCSLVRMYCPELASACQILPTDEVEKFDFYIYPNLVASNEIITIEPNYIAQGTFEILIMDMQGRIINKKTKARHARKIEIAAPQNEGTYILAIRSDATILFSEKIIVY